MARRDPLLGHAFDLARLGAEAWTVVGLRMSKLAAGGPAAAFEAHRMVTEKATAIVEAQVSAALALAGGATHHAASRTVLAGYRRRVNANRRRLTRKT